MSSSDDKTNKISHDQNFKNLILDYPKEAIEFYVPSEAKDLLVEGIKITPIRQEQLKERLGNSYRELDTPLLIEYPNGERESENRVAVLNLPCMQYAENEKYAMFHDALSQFVKLEPRRNKLEKYVEMVHYYSKFDEQDYEEYERQYPQEDETMKTFSQIFTEKGMQAGKQEGMQQGMQQGIKTGELSSLINTLLRLLSIRFGEVPQQVNEQVKQAETEQLNQWIDRVVVADSLESVFT